MGPKAADRNNYKINFERNFIKTSNPPAPLKEAVASETIQEPVPTAGIGLHYHSWNAKVFTRLI